ncbi:MAG: nucleotide exchange factor GrpE [Hyphomicrobium sp.]
MADPKTPGDSNGAEMETETPAGAGPAAEQDIGVPQLRAIIEALQSDLDALKNQNLRLMADMDNLRKRMEREKDEMAKYAIGKFAADVVNVADNFERATNAVPAGAADEEGPLKSLVEGVTMTEREFMNVLERHGVHRLDPGGEAFNPHKHQAVMEVQNPDVAPGTIVQVFQPGYVIADRVLRPAMVVVAKGGTKPGAKPADTPAGPAPGAEPAEDRGEG